MGGRTAKRSRNGPIGRGGIGPPVAAAAPPMPAPGFVSRFRLPGSNVRGDHSFVHLRGGEMGRGRSGRRSVPPCSPGNSFVHFLFRRDAEACCRARHGTALGFVRAAAEIVRAEFLGEAGLGAHARVVTTWRKACVASMVRSSGC